MKTTHLSTILCCAVFGIAFTSRTNAAEVETDTVLHAGVLSPNVTEPDAGIEAFYGEVNMDLSMESGEAAHALLDLRLESVAARPEQSRQHRFRFQTRPGVGLEIPVYKNFRLRAAAKLSQTWGLLRSITRRQAIDSNADPMLELGIADSYLGLHWRAGVAHNEAEAWYGRTPWQAIGQLHINDSAETLSWGLKGRASPDLVEFGLSLRFF